jgi:hypothetical protein
MGAQLLHDPWICGYLLYVGVLSIAFFWDYLRRQAVMRAERLAQNAAVFCNKSRSNRGHLDPATHNHSAC